jgi:predicted aspartyl protease
MGNFFQLITVVGSRGDEVTVEALVDTRATFTSLPSSVLTEIGVRPERQVRMRLADGSLHEQLLGNATMRLDGVANICPVIFGEERSPAAIGAITLEIRLLGADPVGQRLASVIGWRV